MYIIITNDRIPIITETKPACKKRGKLFDMYNRSESDHNFEVIFFNITGSFNINNHIAELIIVRFCIEVGHIPLYNVFL